MVDHFRAQSRPLAKAVSIEPVVFHPRPNDGRGVRARSRSGGADRQDLDHRRGECRSGGHPIFRIRGAGDAYSPKAMADMRKSIGRIQALGSVRIRESETLDAAGRLPVFVEVTERKPRVVGFSARYSTIDGPAFMDTGSIATCSAARSACGSNPTFSSPPATTELASGASAISSPPDIGGRFRVSFLKPALYGSRNDLLIDGAARAGPDRRRPLRRIHQPACRHHRRYPAPIQRHILDAGRIAGAEGQTSDVLGPIDYFVVGTPVSLTYDSTDKPLDPSRGMRITASVVPYPTFLGSTVGMTVTKASASAYYSLDEDARYILAGRIGFGSIVGAPLDEIPANFRFFAGGGGSVRGYRYQSIGPQGPFGYVVGGRSLLEGSLEARIKVTDTIGVVPFVDAGGAFDSGFPDFDDKMRSRPGWDCATTRRSDRSGSTWRLHWTVARATNPSPSMSA